MKRQNVLLICLSIGLFSSGLYGASGSPSKWLASTKERMHQIWYEGGSELYLTGYAWHNRYLYPKEKIDNYNELAAGAGLGKGFVDENGNWHALYAMGFADSHKEFQPFGGYGFLKMFDLPKATHLGTGFTLFVTQRKREFHGIPFPGILPLVALSVSRASMFATYIPGSRTNGNVLFMFWKWTF